MALGVLLWVSWIGFVLFDCSAGIPTIKGYKHPAKTKARNIGDDRDDEQFLSQAFDYANSPTGPVLTSFYSIQQQAPVERKHVLPRKKLPNTASASEVERLVNGNLRDWSLDDSESILLFPLSSSYQPSRAAKPQQSLSQAQSQSAPPRQSPGSDSWKTVGGSQKPAGSSSPNQDFKSGSSDGGFAHLVYENVFEYPEETANGDAKPVSIPGTGSSSPSRFTEWNLTFGKKGYQPHGKASLLKQKLAEFKKVTGQRVKPSPKWRYFRKYNLQQAEQ